MTLKTTTFEIFDAEDVMCVGPAIVTMTPLEESYGIDVDLFIRASCNANLSKEDCKGMVEWLCGVHGWKVTFDE